MATKRKTLSKGLRFEIFKRDNFTCQYCGAHPPSVILHVDHITPVAHGGLNEIDNLITACESCNLGKSSKELSDIPMSLKDKYIITQEREAQIIGYQKILTEKRQRIENQSEKVREVYESFNDGYTLTESAMVSVRKFIEIIGMNETINSMEIACTAKNIKYSNVFKYFCGVCWNRAREQNEVA